MRYYALGQSALRSGAYVLYSWALSRTGGGEKGKKDALRESVLRSGSLAFLLPCSQAGGRGERGKKKKKDALRESVLFSSSMCRLFYALVAPLLCTI